MPIITKSRGFLTRLGRDRAGVAAVELALIAPVLTALVIPMVDLGIGAYDKMRIQNAAEAGAQYALANASSYDASSIQSAATNATSLSGITATVGETCNCITGSAIGTAVSCTTTCADGSKPGTYVSVSTNMSYSLLLSYPGLTNPMPLNGRAMVRIQ
ncbi:MAG TPA: TadE/TadG family type IV pilus assembly protein [Stellaceae bacterium]|nr:TadE/TadG family type IV pilus assembly protein [Stellaceae bacterium]